MALLKFLKGKKANLPTQKKDGQIYYTTDENKLYIDDGTTRSAVNAEKADKLSTARTIQLSRGVLSSVRTFDGSKDLNIAVDQIYDTYTRFHTNSSIAGDISAIGASMVDELKANRIANIPSNYITCEATRDGGETWTTYPLSAAKIRSLTLATDANLNIGFGTNTPTSSDKATNQDKLRLTFAPFCYCDLKKIMINVSTHGAKDCYLKIEGIVSGQTEYTTIKDGILLSGWPGWNEVNQNFIWDSQDSKQRGSHRYQYLRLTFYFTGAVQDPYGGFLQLKSLRFYAPTQWSGINTLQEFGVPYNVLENYSTKFMGRIYDSSGKSTSTNDYTNEDKVKLTDLYTKKELDNKFEYTYKLCGEFSNTFQLEYLYNGTELMCPVNDNLKLGNIYNISYSDTYFDQQLCSSSFPIVGIREMVDYKVLYYNDNNMIARTDTPYEKDWYIQVFNSSTYLGKCGPYGMGFCCGPESMYYYGPGNKDLETDILKVYNDYLETSYSSLAEILPNIKINLMQRVYYNTGDNVVWTENGWDNLSGKVDLSPYATNEEVNTLINDLDLVGQTYSGSTYGEIFNGYAGNIASGKYSHAEGQQTKALGDWSHAENRWTSANDLYTHAEGFRTIASSSFQHVQGKNNIEDTEDKYAHIVGNGVLWTKRSNAHTLDWDGNAWFAGNIKIGGSGYDDTSAVEVATKDYVSSPCVVIPTNKIMKYGYNDETNSVLVANIKDIYSSQIIAEAYSSSGIMIALPLYKDNFLPNNNFFELYSDGTAAVYAKLDSNYNLYIYVQIYHDDGNQGPENIRLFFRRNKEILSQSFLDRNFNSYTFKIPEVCNANNCIYYEKDTHIQSEYISLNWNSRIKGAVQIFFYGDNCGAAPRYSWNNRQGIQQRSQSTNNTTGYRYTLDYNWYYKASNGETTYIYIFADIDSGDIPSIEPTWSDLSSNHGILLEDKSNYIDYNSLLNA